MADAPGSRARVVVVDDDRLIRELVRDTLVDTAEVECCHSAEAALAALAREPADLVVSDLEMPGLSGLDLLEEVRRAHPGTDFVVLTGRSSVDSAVAALRMGAADYLTKPIQPRELSSAVHRVLGHKRAIRENARLRGALATLESCRTLMHCLDSGEVYAVALELLLRAIPRRRGIALFRRSAIPLSDGIAFRGFPEAEARRLRHVLVQEKAVAIESMQRVEVVSGGAMDAVMRAASAPGTPVLVVPLRGRESEAGVVWIFEDGKPFEEADLEQASLIAQHAEIALSNAERYLRAKERAFIDDVTEVYNARYLLQATEHEIQRAARYGTELCVLFLDLDRFKLVNDQYGHLVGSQTLRQLSQVLRHCIRQVDTLARYGGDEFTILLADTDLETGLQVAERIRSSVAAARFEGQGAGPLQVTLSVGVAAFPTHGQSAEGLLDVADKAMYRAKSLGRNQTCSASDL